MDKKFLLIQIRDNAHIADEEHRLICRAAGTSQATIDRCNVFSDMLSSNAISAYDGIIVGGSRFAPRDRYPQKDTVRGIMRRAIDQKRPLLGICFGFEVLMEEAGGAVILHEKHGREFGTRTMYLTAEGKRDPIFLDLPLKFLAHANHHWHAPHTPSSMILLARGNAVECQAVRLADAPVYGVQFHPELDVAGMRRRVDEYRAMESGGGVALHRANIQNAPHASRIISNFIRFS